MGGSLHVQTLVGLTGIVTTVSMVLAYINIKRLQLDQHRAWMLRGWVWAFMIVSLRIIQLPAMDIVSHLGTFYEPMACHSIDFILSLAAPDLASHFYPECDGHPDHVVAVKANKFAVPTEEGIPRLHEIGASVQVTFGTCCLVAIFLHAVGVEIYLHLTQGEANRLKRISRQRQLERGWNNPGDASWLTKEALGDVDEFDYKECNGKKSLDINEPKATVSSASEPVEPLEI